MVMLFIHNTIDAFKLALKPIAKLGYYNFYHEVSINIYFSRQTSNYTLILAESRFLNYEVFPFIIIVVVDFPKLNLVRTLQ